MSAARADDVAAASSKLANATIANVETKEFLNMPLLYLLEAD
jgi:hypothetical protein